MPPQPLSRVRSQAAIMATPDAIALRPKLAALIAEIIARWADIEANTGTILSYVLRAEAAPVTAMLHAVVSSSAQMDMIEAAGRAKLFDPELEIYEAVIKIARAAAKKRNAIAHHVWGYTDELPEALLLIEPEAYGEIFVELQQVLKSPTPGLRVPQINSAQTMVYRENDFIQIVEEFKTVSKCTTFLINYLEPRHSARDQMYRHLCSEPLIDAALKTLRKDRVHRPKP